MLTRREPLGGAGDQRRLGGGLRIARVRLARLRLDGLDEITGERMGRRGDGAKREERHHQRQHEGE
jgi:hypothetical protein